MLKMVYCKITLKLLSGMNAHVGGVCCVSYDICFIVVIQS